MRLVTLAASASLLFSGAAWAQTGSVVEYYRAYNAALERGDLPAAETSAAAAVAASEARDGDGGRTAVLLVNLAQVQIDQERLAEALISARRVAAIAEARGEAAGVDPLAVQLLLGHAELSAPGNVGAQRLRTALAQAQNTTGVEAQSYAAAKALGEWAFRERQYEEAAQAWTTAIGFVPGADGESVTARAVALMGRGVAYTMLDDLNYRQPETGTRFTDGPDARAETDFTEALRLIYPLATVRGDGELTQAQTVYARALAWSSTLRARLERFGWRPNLSIDDWVGLTLDLNETDGHSVCRMRLTARPLPEYPPEALRRFGVGVVVVRVVVSASGAVSEVRPLAVVGGQEFADAINAVAPQWQVEPGDEYQEPCTRASVKFVRVQFRLRT